MTITPTGFAVFALALLFLATAPARLMAALIFFSSFSATAVINFSNYGMAPAVVFFGAFLIWKFLSGELLESVTISADHGVSLSLVAGFGLASVASLLVNQLERDVLPVQTTQTAYIVFGVLLTIILAIDLVRADRLELAISALRNGAYFMAGWGVLQAVCFYSGVEYPSVVFNNSASHFADMFDQRAGEGLIRIASVATEPSFMTASLMIFGAFGSTVLLVEPRFRTGPWLRAVCLTLGVVAASTSTTGYAALIVLGLLLARRRPVWMMGFTGGATIAAALLLTVFPSFREALYQFTFNKTSSGSYIERSGAVWDAFNLFYAHPLLGLGWGGNFSFSIISTLLADSGLIGSFLFVVAIGATILASGAARRRAPASQWRLRAYAEGLENAMVVYMAVSVVTGFHFVVADFWCLWALSLAVPSALCAATVRRSLKPVRVFAAPSASVATPALHLR